MAQRYQRVTVGNATAPELLAKFAHAALQDKGMSESDIVYVIQGLLDSGNIDTLSQIGDLADQSKVVPVPMSATDTRNFRRPDQYYLDLLSAYRDCLAKNRRGLEIKCNEPDIPWDVMMNLIDRYGIDKPQPAVFASAVATPVDRRSGGGSRRSRGSGDIMHYETPVDRRSSGSGSRRSSGSGDIMHYAQPTYLDLESRE